MDKVLTEIKVQLLLSHIIIIIAYKQISWAVLVHVNMIELTCLFISWV